MVGWRTSSVTPRRVRRRVEYFRRYTICSATRIQTTSTPEGKTMAEYTLPPLPYDFGALEPHIDARTMEIHYTKHHQTYVTNLNNALKDLPEFQDKPIDKLIADL